MTNNYNAISLNAQEILVRMFFRSKSQPETWHKLSVTDFERRPHIQEGGLSFYRSSMITYKSMIESVKRQPKLWRGLAGIEVLKAHALGNSFLSDDPKIAHLCMHCENCDLLKYDCSAGFFQTCPFHPNEDESVRNYLASQMQIIFLPRATEDFQRIFGKDLDERDAVAANATYLKRYNEQPLIQSSAEEEAVRQEMDLL